MIYGAIIGVMAIFIAIVLGTIAAARMCRFANNDEEETTPTKEDK